MSINNSHDLKQLRTRLAKANAEQQAAKEEVKIAQKRESEAAKLCKELQQKISQLEGKQTIITEHALLRYFERVLGYDLDVIANGLLTDQARSILSTLSNGRIPSIGCRLVVKDGVVVTIET